jgi:hypothetical protein
MKIKLSRYEQRMREKTPKYKKKLVKLWREKYPEVSPHSWRIKPGRGHTSQGVKALSAWLTSVRDLVSRLENLESLKNCPEGESP